MVRAPGVGPAADRPQRRRQPTRALPGRRRAEDHPDGGQRRRRRRGLRRDLAAAGAARVPADPGDHRRLAALPAPARPALRGGARARGPARRADRRQPRRHRHDQGVRGRGARGSAGRRGVDGLRRGQPRRDHAERGLRPADPDGDPRRVLGDLGPRRPHGAQRHAGDRVVLRLGLHDPAAAVAADRAGRDARPLSARGGLDPADPRPHRRADRRRGGRPSCPRWRRVRARRRARSPSAT